MSAKRGFLPCFSRHIDKSFPVEDFYANSVFVTKLQEFVAAIVDSPSIDILKGRIHPKGGIQQIDPSRNAKDRELCSRLNWTDGKIYRVDYGDNAYRLVFGLEVNKSRCYILALDSKHRTRGDKNRR